MYGQSALINLYSWHKTLRCYWQHVSLQELHLSQSTFQYLNLTPTI